MATIEVKAKNSPLTFKISSQDFDLINDYIWYINNDGYVVRYDKSNSKFKTVLLHREIMKQKEPNIDPTNLQCDHIDHNPLNNSRENLRYVTASENCRNKKNKITNNIYPGISRCKNFSKRAKKWRAHIEINKYQYNIGFDSFEEAFIWRILMEFWRDYLKQRNYKL